MNLLGIQSPAHLDQKGIIEAGSFYTPRHLIEEVERLISPYLKDRENVVIFDSSVGGGAFTQIMEGLDYRLADTDSECCNSLAAFTDPARVFNTNSLQEVAREKFDIHDDAYLVQVGNPPYNDTTSAYKSGEKGENLCDEDLFDRDLGVSFLKSYAKLNSNLVCVLHPLAYLIKQANFKRLKNFRENYTLRDGVIFSSKEFKGTGSKKFPIMIGLYERTEEGMDYETVRDCNFRILDSEQTFQLSRFTTTDGYIRKYPPKKDDPKESTIGLYYYTFRDINSLQRSASFQNTPHYNAIVLEVEEFYKYAYLFVFRTFFKPENAWLYGNLSPLIDLEYIEANKAKVVQYALYKHPVFAEIPKEHLEKIRAAYGITESLEADKAEQLEAEFTELVNGLV